MYSSGLIILMRPFQPCVPVDCRFHSEIVSYSTGYARNRMKLKIPLLLMSANAIY